MSPQSQKSFSRKNFRLIGFFSVLIAILFFANQYITLQNGEPTVYETIYVEDTRPTIYAITPTRRHFTQMADLTRLAQTLMHIENVFWVVVEDSETETSLVRNILDRYGFKSRSTLLHVKSEKTEDRGTALRLEGVEQRNRGLEFVRTKISNDPETHSIVYFLDEGNTYSIFLFDEMETIERGRVGVWPVGFAGELMVERPLVDEDGFVSGFNSEWDPEIIFPLDLAAFAISSDLILHHPEALFSSDIYREDQQGEILKTLTEIGWLQPLAQRCSKVLVWRTRTAVPSLTYEKALMESKLPKSNLGFEV